MTGRKILIIESRLSFSNEVNKWFTSEGFKTFSALDGEDGIEIAVSELPDLILCDKILPDMKGKDVLVVLRNIPSTSMIPFILMTPSVNKESKSDLCEIDDYIIKPISTGRRGKTNSVQSQKNSNIRIFAVSALKELRLTIIKNLNCVPGNLLKEVFTTAPLLEDPCTDFLKTKLEESIAGFHDSAFVFFRIFHNYLTFNKLEFDKCQKTMPSSQTECGKLCKSIAIETANRYNRIDDLQLSVSEENLVVNENEFSKIIEELTDNAFKFSQPGQSVVISFGMENHSFRLIVKDHGQGMMATDIHRIGAYMQFSRKVHKQQGTGLGLFITKSLIGKHFGKLFIESMPGKGSTFLVIFPEASAMLNSDNEGCLALQI